jgi:hypothetical protein
MTIRETIKKQAGVIPDAVMNGSVQTSIRWKERAMNALRIANNPKSTEHDLKIALSELTRPL